jgi:Tfp pilus assembly ATPase PilU
MERTSSTRSFREIRLLFEQHLTDLYHAGTITLEAAKEASSNPSDFERNIAFGKNSTSNSTNDGPSERFRNLEGVQIEFQPKKPA